MRDNLTNFKICYYIIVNDWDCFSKEVAKKIL